jgi:hypothetical protein
MLTPDQAGAQHSQSPMTAGADGDDNSDSTYVRSRTFLFLRYEPRPAGRAKPLQSGIRTAPLTVFFRISRACGKL